MGRGRVRERVQGANQRRMATTQDTAPTKRLRIALPFFLFRLQKFEFYFLFVFYSDHTYRLVSCTKKGWMGGRIKVAGAFLSNNPTHAAPSFSITRISICTACIHQHYVSTRTSFGKGLYVGCLLLDPSLAGNDYVDGLQGAHSLRHGSLLVPIACLLFFFPFSNLTPASGTSKRRRWRHDDGHWLGKRVHLDLLQGSFFFGAASQPAIPLTHHHHRHPFPRERKV
ncbi:hypothetical protein HDK77DRAFT_75769 [Phyllosticta capitalensis]|uniref:uncharacterized protein n=1 Tax=Phyllosticta capitalensis TaxID=121624 RepID=UPI00312F69FE